MKSRSTNPVRSTDFQEQQGCPYVLHTLLTDIPLSVEEECIPVQITCVEYLDQNLYIGTSAAEILHYVQISFDPKDAASSPSYILASKILPLFQKSQKKTLPGIQQILLLPRVSKACILCNWTVTFYALPELSPVFGNIQIRLCNWIGGVDLNENPKEDLQDAISPSVTVLVSLGKKIKVVKIGETPRGLRTIDFAGSVISARRGSYACIADERSYALLDIDRLLKIPLFSISSLNDSRSTNSSILTEESSRKASEEPTKYASFAQENAQTLSSQGQIRFTGLGTFMGINSYINDSNSKNIENLVEETQQGNFDLKSPNFVPNILQSPKSQIQSSSKDFPQLASLPLKEDHILQEPPRFTNFLKPHIVSPTPQEFLLVTGTTHSDRGVGMFVNLEGDPTRSTLEFDQYPHDIVVDGRGVDVEPTPTTVDDEEEGFVLASLTRNETENGIEIQRWDINIGHDEFRKYWLEIPNQSPEEDKPNRIGLKYALDAQEVHFSEVVDKLSLKLFRPFNIKFISDNSNSAIHLNPVSHTTESQDYASTKLLSKIWEDQRSEEERQFSRRFDRTRTRILVWSGNKIWWIVRNPLVLRLDSIISEIVKNLNQDKHQNRTLYQQHLVRILNNIRGREAKTETEYLSVAYIRQRAGLLLFLNNLNEDHDSLLESEHLIAEDALLGGGLDPRVILSIVPYLKDEIDQGKSGIWIHGGVKDVIDEFISSHLLEITNKEDSILMSDQALNSIKRYLIGWRKKKGFGSIANEAEVFKSVDAGLLVVLLRLDRLTSPGPRKAKSVRFELYDLVDHGIDCFERAITLLESENRLYVLSRLYQSRKMSREVLATWRRILEGELDSGGEFVDGEQKMQDYLRKIRKVSLIEEYGVWLASRNSKLGIQTFAEDRNDIKIEPKRILKILRNDAPAAVKDYLEYLVFQKHHLEYVNELITLYLDIVTKKLENSPESRSLLRQSYEGYRALRPPKITYHQFITENSIEEDWWESRLRLLHLLGSGQDSVERCDFKIILERIAPYSQELVPELIILDGRQANHDKALRLLTHVLGDYDTAINYCLLGGSGIYHSIYGTVTQETIPTRDQQTRLFGVLLSEFLQIDNVSDCIQQTSNLLERFGGWFDVEHVLRVIPDSWSVDLISGFLVNAIRQIVRERSETMIVKALSGVENLKINIELIEKITAAGVSVET